MSPIPLARRVVGALSLLAAASPLAALELHVSPGAAPGGDGSAARPLATVAEAVDLLARSRAAEPATPVTVVLADGVHRLAAPVVLNAARSGTAEAPVVFRAANRGQAVLTAARPLDVSGMRPLEDPELLARLRPEARGKVVVVDVGSAGLRNAGPFPDHAREAINLFDLFWNGRRLQVARWPNGNQYATMGKVVRSGSYRGNQPEGGIFEYRGERPASWAKAAEEGNLRLRGFWRVPWVAETIRVAEVDTAARTIRFAVSTPNGIGSKYTAEVNGSRVGDGKEPWFAWNLIEEIDQPGEWAIDPRRRLLFVWLPDEAATDGLEVADELRPIVDAAGASHVRFEGIVFRRSHGSAVSIREGRAVQLLGCRVEDVTRTAVMIRGGRDHRVQSCDIVRVGLSGIDLLGGDRATLAPSGHVIENNLIREVGLIAPVPALVAGLDIKNQQLVGARIARNRVHDASYGGITFAGNDNVLEHNEVYRVGLDGGDLGGFYATGGWTMRGNVLRGNFVHHAENANAFYFDDGASGVLMEGNLVYRAESGAFIGGGHDHVVRGNTFIACERAIHVDDRGVARKYVANDPRLRGDLDSVPWKAEPWASRYPALLTILDADPSIPRGNLLAGNVSVGCHVLARRSGKEETLGGFDIRDNPEVAPEGLFVDAGGLDFALARDPGLPLPGLEAASAGLVVDAWRTEVPPRDLKLLREGDTRRRSFDSQQDVEAYPR